SLYPPCLASARTRPPCDHVPGSGALGLHRAAADGRLVGAVIGLVGGRDRGGHRALADVGGGRGGVGAQLVVALVGAGQGDVGGDLLAVGGRGGDDLTAGGRAADALGGDDHEAGALGLR